MKSLRATVGDGAMVSWINKNGERVAIPLVKLGKEWKQVGVYLKFGASQSDPTFATVFPLPHNWKPSQKILRTIRRAGG